MNTLKHEQVLPDADLQRTWSRFKYPQSLIRYGIFLLILVFVGYSLAYLNVNLGRFFTMFGRMGHMFAYRYYPPEISYVLDKSYLRYVLETIQMAYLGALIGLLLSIPIS